MLKDNDVEEIYRLCLENKLYYDYCPPFITRQAVLDELKAVPGGKTMEDKYYVGFYQKEELIAVMDLIDGYPEKEIAYIGFFMTDSSVQNSGVGTTIIDYLCHYLAGIGYHSVRLAWVKGNPQAEHFWIKNKFVPIMETKSNVAEKVIVASRVL